ncbi:lipopolysaccharide biosynthesis protein [Brevundimonas bacteroides]|uniref:lipopolysaccharide biosynthesis protein n=1 Tax=Brevundimonas bacteroides TaxID=74311 RepID=UPI00068AD9C0|nr:oligosaccharide flippase family protein [Brevundimonas bacteroides]
MTRSIGVLISGTALAHAITATAMPVATRLFTPQDFAAATTFSSLVGVLVVAACLRYELALPLPEDEVEAVNLLALSCGLTVAFTLVVAGIMALIPPAGYALLGQPGLTPWIWLLPPAMLIGGLYLALQMWYVRKKGFGAIARSRVTQSAAAAAAQLGMGFAGAAPQGLLVGQMFNYGAGAVGLGVGLLFKERALLRRVSWQGVVQVARIHQRFPRFSVMEALANAASIHLPVLLIAALTVGPEAGYLALAMFLLQAPMALVGNAVGQVYLSGAPDAHREGRLAVFTSEMMARLMKAAAGPIVFLAVAAPAAIGLVFGADWTRAGVLVSWMAPWFLLQFVAAPASTALHVVGRQSWAMMLQMFGLVLRSGMVVLAIVIDARFATEAFAISGFVFYAIFNAVVLRAAGALPLAGLSALRASAAPALIGLFIGLLVSITTASISEQLVKGG